MCAAPTDYGFSDTDALRLTVYLDTLRTSPKQPGGSK